MSSAAELGPRHLPGVVGASTIVTPGLREIDAAVRSLYDDGGIVDIDGAVGLGKTYATRHVLQSLGVSVHWVDMPDTPRGREATARIFRAVMREDPDERHSQFRLTNDTVDALSGLKSVLVIDEAANLTVGALRQIRYPHDRDTTRALIVLIGAGVHAKVMKVPEFDNRVSRRITLNPLSSRHLRELLPQLHPLFANTDLGVLTTLAKCAKGNLRNWAHILEAANHFHLDPEAGIDPKACQLIVRGITGRKAA